MSTRSQILLKNEDGSFCGIYCHNNGSMYGVGEILLHEYQDLEKVINLIELGSLSSLKATLEDSRSYFRDLKEPWEWNKPIHRKSEKEIIDKKDGNIEYVYIYNRLKSNMNKWDIYFYNYRGKLVKCDLLDVLNDDDPILKDY